MFLSLSYIQSRSPYGEIPGQPNQWPPPGASNKATSTTVAPTTNGDTAHAPAAPPLDRNGELAPEDPAEFNRMLQSLAADLVTKEQQIEVLIDSLPGIGNSEADQERRMREFEVELRQVELERARAEERKEQMEDLLGELIVSIKRVP